MWLRVKNDRQRFGREARHANIPGSYAKAVRQAAAGTVTPVVAIDLSSLSEFERKVLLLLRQIPRGEVRSYGWLAREAGRPKAARVVGNIMARNPMPLILPAGGGIGNCGFGTALKRDLLLREGVSIRDIERPARKRVHL